MTPCPLLAHSLHRLVHPRELAPGEDTADLAPPVHARRDVDARHEAFDGPRAEALHRLLHLDRECVIVVLVADEHREHVVIDGHCCVPPSRDLSQRPGSASVSQERAAREPRPSHRAFWQS